MSEKKLIDEKIIINNTFTRDYLFKSPSGAATAILKTQANGFTEWKNEKGTSLKEIEEDRVK